MNGFIKLHRQLLDWEWYNDTNVKITFLHLLLTANFRPKRWKGITINRGELVTSIGHLAKDLKLSNQQIRTVLKKLQSSGEVNIKTTNKNTLITLVKFDLYQDREKENNNQITNHQQTNNNQITTTKELKNKRINTNTNKEEQILQNKPIDRDQARELIFANFGGEDKAAEAIAEEYQKQVGFKVDALTVQTAVASFIQKGITEYYTNLQTWQQVQAKLMQWITNAIRNQRTNKIAATHSPAKKLNYRQHFIDSAFREKSNPKNHISFAEKQGLIKKQEEDFKTKLAYLQEIHSKHFSKYPNLNLYTIYDVLYTNLGKKYGIEEIKKIRGLKSFVSSCTDYIQNKGHLRSELVKQQQRATS